MLPQIASGGYASHTNKSIPVSVNTDNQLIEIGNTDQVLFEGNLAELILFNHNQTQLEKLNNIKKACLTKMFVAQD